MKVQPRNYKRKNTAPEKTAKAHKLETAKEKRIACDVDKVVLERRTSEDVCI